MQKFISLLFKFFLIFYFRIYESIYRIKTRGISKGNRFF